MYLDRWCASSCSSNEVRFTSAMLRFHSLRSHPDSHRSGPFTSAMLRFHSLSLCSYLSHCLNNIRFHPVSRRVGRFIQLVRSFRSFRSRCSLHFTSFHFTSLHSSPSAPLVAGFDFIVFFIIPRPISREIRAEAERLESKTQRAKRCESG